MSPGKTETIISKKDTQQTFNAQPAFATTPKVFASRRRGGHPASNIEFGKTRQKNRPAENSDVGLQAKSLHQFLPDLHLQIRLQTAQDFFAALRVHRREISHQLVARLIFRVLAQADADGDERRDGPDSNVCSRNHSETSNAQPAFATPARRAPNVRYPIKSRERTLAGGGILHPMRIVFSFLPTVMMPGRGRLRCYPRWIIIWTEADAVTVRLRDGADGQQKRARHDGDDQFHN